MAERPEGDDGAPSKRAIASKERSGRPEAQPKPYRDPLEVDVFDLSAEELRAVASRFNIDVRGEQQRYLTKRELRPRVLVYKSTIPEERHADYHGKAAELQDMKPVQLEARALRHGILGFAAMGKEKQVVALLDAKHRYDTTGFMKPQPRPEPEADSPLPASLTRPISPPPLRRTRTDAEPGADLA